MNSTERKKYDVVIAGGGMIGIAMALSLSSFDLKIAVIEKIKRASKEQPSFETMMGGLIIIITIAVHSYLAIKKTQLKFN